MPGCRGSLMRPLRDGGTLCARQLTGFGQRSAGVTCAPDTLEVRSGQTGWRTSTVLKLLFVAFWTACWAGYTTQASDTFSALFSAVPTAVGLVLLLQGLELPFVEFELRITGDEVTITRRSPFRSKRWHAPLKAVDVGQIEVFNDEPGSSPGYGAHRFIPIRMRTETVRFMDGHPDQRLHDVRERLLPHIAARAAQPRSG